MNEEMVWKYPAGTMYVTFICVCVCVFFGGNVKPLVVLANVNMSSI